MKANVELQISELVLRGLPYRQRYAIAEAVEMELQRLLDEGELLPALAAGLTLPEVRVDDLRLVAGASPGVIGAQIAGSIYRSLAGSQLVSGNPGRSTP